MKILVVGAAIIDIIMKVDRLPKSGEDILCKEKKVVVGGCAYNVASTLRNLSCSHDLCVPVGTGAYADIIQKKLKEEGYSVLIKDHTEDNGSCLSLVEMDGERTFITVQGVEKEFRQEWLESLDVENYTSVYIAGYQVGMEGKSAIADWLLKLSGKQIFFAPGPIITEIPQKTMKQILRAHPVVHLNEKEIMDYAGETDIEKAMSMLYEQSKNLVIVTRGSEGTAYYDGKEFSYISGEKAVVADTIGAGDSHIGAIMGGLSKGLDLKASIHLANKVAAGIVGVEGPVMTKNEFEMRIGEYTYE